MILTGNRSLMSGRWAESSSRTREGYEAHCLQFDLVEVAPTAEEAEQAIKDVITAHIEYSLAHDNREYLFQSAPLDVWNAFFSSRPYKRLRQ